MKYTYNEFVETRELSDTITNSIPMLVSRGIDPQVFYNFLIENPEVLNDPTEFLAELETMGQNASLLGRTRLNPLNWGMKGQVARNTYARNKDLTNKQWSMDQAMNAYQGVPEEEWPAWLKQYKDSPDTYQKQAGNYQQDLAKANVQKYHGGGFPRVNPKAVTPGTPPQSNVGSAGLASPVPPSPSGLPSNVSNPASNPAPVPPPAATSNASNASEPVDVGTAASAASSGSSGTANTSAARTSRGPTPPDATAAGTDPTATGAIDVKGIVRGVQGVLKQGGMPPKNIRTILQSVRQLANVSGITPTPAATPPPPAAAAAPPPPPPVRQPRPAANRKPKPQNNKGRKGK